MKRTNPPCLVHAGALAARVLAGSIVALLAPREAQAQNTANDFTGASDGSLLLPGKWSLGVLPGVAHDAVFTATTGIRTLSANNLTVGSFNVTAASGKFSIQSQTSTATASNLTLGGTGNLGNSVSGTAEDLLYAATGTTFNIRGDNSNGAGVLRVTLGQSGNFNIAGTANISAGIAEGGSHFGFTKTGGGSLTLNGLNSYSGNTIVSSGTLVLADNAGLRFVVGDSSNTWLAGSGTVVLNGDFTIDTAAVTASAGSWTLVEVATLNETFGATFSVAGVGWAETSNVWKKIEGTKAWTFTEATGVLALTRVGLGAYDNWATTTCGLSVANAAFDCDGDGDGVANGLEWVLGGDPTRNDAAAILPVVTGNNSNGLTLVFKRAVASLVETSLVVDWGSGPGALSNMIVIGDADVGPNGNQPVVDIDAPATGQVTVNIPAANASGGKLFARLRAVQK
jgi:autotransporter-associated beta strand protein